MLVKRVMAIHQPVKQLTRLPSSNCKVLLSRTKTAVLNRNSSIREQLKLVLIQPPRRVKACRAAKARRQRRASGIMQHGQVQLQRPEHWLQHTTTAILIWKMWWHLLLGLASPSRVSVFSISNAMWGYCTTVCVCVSVHLSFNPTLCWQNPCYKGMWVQEATCQQCHQKHATSARTYLFATQSLAFDAQNTQSCSSRMACWKRV